MNKSGGVVASWAAGTSVLFAAYISWAIAVIGFDKEIVGLMWLLWISPLIAATVTGTMNPRNTPLTAVALALTATLFATALNAVQQILGAPVDFPGTGGALWLGSITFAYALVLVFVGFGATRAFRRLVTWKKGNERENRCRK